MKQLPLPTELDRRFEAIVFAWDGVAPPDGSGEATRLRQLIEDLSGLGMHLAVVTNATDLAGVDGGSPRRRPGRGVSGSPSTPGPKSIAPTQRPGT